MAVERSKPERSTSEWYRDFAVLEARGQSAIFEDWAQGVAGDPEILALIDGLPLQKRQPNLVFATARLLGVPERTYSEFRAWLLAEWPRVAPEILVRMTQTNEPRRCTAILPALALAAGGKDVAMLELGASAGLCLYPDRYSYRYADGNWLHPEAGPSTVQLTADTSGPVPVPSRLPSIVWRAGIDLDPIDVSDPNGALWLQTLIWPEQHRRRQRVEAAASLVRSDPPTLVRGNAIDELAALAAQAPKSTVLVILTSAMLVYLPYLERMSLVEAIRGLSAQWISLDGVGVLPEVDARAAETYAPDLKRGQFTLSLDGAPLATVGPHGQFVNWPKHFD
ncbi:MAG: DUF2332 domain-containing protein [Terrimesophilobacter sp.]